MTLKWQQLFLGKITPCLSAQCYITKKAKASLAQFDLSGITAGILVEFEIPNQKIPEGNHLPSSVSQISAFDLNMTYNI